MRLLLLVFLWVVSMDAKELRVLISGFETFGGFKHNPTELMVKQIQKGALKLENMSIKAIVLPVTYFQSWEVLKKEMEAYQPDIVLAFGYAPSSSGVRLERLSHNYDRGSRDNAGVSHRGKIIKEDANETIPAKLPLESLQSYLQKQGFKVSTSQDAGGYICNHLFYYLMHYIQDKQIQGGFIHISDMPVEGKEGSM
ncbi:MAG: pyroglutamyl-peptidase I, partial [Campylobacterales bacterium]|nr:pyroglutamyl-peptidase I [Campylobacterales bacterium]